MKSSTLLRIGSIAAVLFAAGHSAGAPWTPVKVGPEGALIESMKSLRFAVMGTQRAYWDFYVGFGVSVSICVFALAILLWQLAALANADPKRARPMMLTILAAFIGLAFVTLEFFFIVPVALTLISCTLILWAWIQARREH